LARAQRFAAEPINLHVLRHKLELIDQTTSDRLLSISCQPETAWSREEQDIVLASTSRVRATPTLGNLPGLAFELGLFRFTDASGHRHDGRELQQAADIYAGMHRQVWGKLSADIEASLTERYGSEAFVLLLEVGRVTSPPPPASHFRALVAGTPAAAGEFGEADPEEYLRRRLRLADRFAAARADLAKAHRRAPAIVENIVVWGILPNFLDPEQTQAHGPVALSRALDDQAVFVAGLKALAEHFGLFDHRHEARRRAPPQGTEAPAGAAAERRVDQVAEALTS
jgi:hypothetical protein